MWLWRGPKNWTICTENNQLHNIWIWSVFFLNLKLWKELSLRHLINFHSFIYAKIWIILWILNWFFEYQKKTICKHSFSHSIIIMLTIFFFTLGLVLSSSSFYTQASHKYLGLPVVIVFYAFFLIYSGLKLKSCLPKYISCSLLSVSCSFC